MLSFSLIVYLASAVTAHHAQSITTVPDMQVNATFLTAGVIPDTYIVALRSEPSGDCRSTSTHALFYRSLHDLSVNWTITKEYHDPILQGAVVRLHDSNDYGKLAEATCIELVSPVRFGNTPRAPARRRSSRYKRANGVPWSHTATGVDILHANGFFGQGIKVGIVDEGVDYNHWLLGGGIGPNHKVVGGYDCIGDENTPPSPYPMDREGHGTHLAGIIGAEPDLSRGIVGVAHGASINAYRVVGPSNFFRDNIMLEGFIRADRDENNVILFAVYQPGGWGRTPLTLAVNRIAAKGRVVVVLVGNFGMHGPWTATDLGDYEGVIPVGDIEYAFPAMPVPEGLRMHFSSCTGPSNNLHLRPVISAPGTDVHSTWPLSLGEYRYGTGSSQAAAFVAGAAALWLEVKGRPSENALWARSAFVSTAVPIFKYSSTSTLLESVASQGAGLIQVHPAAVSSVTLRPVELLLNDTEHPKLEWRLLFRNKGQNTVTYTLTHEPAGTAPTIRGIQPVAGSVSLVSRPAVAIISPPEARVKPGKTKLVTVRFEPPVGLSPATFPVYSGYIKATGSDGSVLQSVYLGVAASMNQIRVLDNTNERLGYMLPRLENLLGIQVPEQQVFTMTLRNVPRVIYRLAFGTPLLLIELIDARTTERTPSQSGGVGIDRGASSSSRGSSSRSSNQRSGSWGSGRWGSGRWGSGRWGSGRFSRIWRTGSAGSGRGRGGSADARVADPMPFVGTLYEIESPARHRWAFPYDQTVSSRVVRPVFTDGSPVPDGSYRIRLRVLKPFGDRASMQDYEVWISQSFVINRAQQ